MTTTDALWVWATLDMRAVPASRIVNIGVKRIPQIVDAHVWIKTSEQEDEDDAPVITNFNVEEKDEFQRVLERAGGVARELAARLAEAVAAGHHGLMVLDQGSETWKLH